MTSQLVIFKAFLFIFFRPPDPKSEKKIPVNQLIKKFWPYRCSNTDLVFPCWREVPFTETYSAVSLYYTTL